MKTLLTLALIAGITIAIIADEAARRNAGAVAPVTFNTHVDEALAIVAADSEAYCALCGSTDSHRELDDVWGPAFAAAHPLSERAR